VRESCKICHEPIRGEKLFTSHMMDYFLCPVCGHLNSAHEDTQAFAQKVYIDDDYAGNYSAADREKYEKRLELIYVPKARFLLDCLKEDGIEPETVRLLDDGAGSGYFVRAMQKLNADAVGIEISPSQVAFANEMAGAQILKQIDAANITGEIRRTDRQVLSAIGVLEHIISLDETLQAVKENKNIEYVYASVPMFSFSALFEATHQSCYNRHLGGTHTHLFSNSSLEYMARSMGFEIAHTWRFGSDMMDLYRFLCVTLEQGGNGGAKKILEKEFLPLIDQLQLVADKGGFSSELHLVMKRK
jgi:predicted TPR repeat methyltransferase